MYTGLWTVYRQYMVGALRKDVRHEEVSQAIDEHRMRDLTFVSSVRHAEFVGQQAQDDKVEDHGVGIHRDEELGI